MNTFVKISSSEGGVFTADNNLVSFDIPEGQYYNLDSAYLNLVCSASVNQEFERASVNAGGAPFNLAVTGDTASTAQGGNGVYLHKITVFEDNYTAENDALVPNEAIVKNLSLTSQNAGVIEEIKRNDILRTNLKFYNSYRDEAEGSNYETLFNGKYGGINPTSIFSDINREGQISSRNLLRQPVRIPLKNMMNFCKVQQYNTNKYGRTKLRLELDIQRIRVTQMNGQDVAGNIINGRAPRTVDDLAGVDLGTQGMFRMCNLTNVIGSAMNEIMLSCEGAAGGVGSNQVIPRRINRAEDIPFYVGQKINVAATYTFAGGKLPRGMGVTGRVKLVTRRIIEIKYNRGETTVGIPGLAGVPNSVTLVLNSPIDDTATSGTALDTGETYTGIVVRGAVCNFNPFQVDFAEIVLEQLAPQNVVADNGQPIQYTTFETEEFSTPPQNSFQRQFECPPNCSNLYIMRPEVIGGGGGGSLTSTQGSIEQYRIRVDNKDTSDRAIGLRSTNNRNAAPDPLHLQKLSIALQNSNLPVKNLSERGLDIDDVFAWNPNNRNIDKFLIGQVLPITNAPKQVQLNIDSTANGPQRLALFKEVIKSI